jgi:hypothetical protein
MNQVFRSAVLIDVGEDLSLLGFVCRFPFILFPSLIRPYCLPFTKASYDFIN